MHDFVILVASTRRGGRSLAEIARDELGPFLGLVTAVAILFIVVIALAGLGNVVVGALAESAWGVFTVGASIPIALAMGLYIYHVRGGIGARASARRRSSACVLLFAALIFGKIVADSPASPSTSSSRAPSLTARHGDLRLRRERPPGVDAPLPARLPLELPQDRHDLPPRRRRHRRQPADPDAGRHDRAMPRRRARS